MSQQVKPLATKPDIPMTGKIGESILMCPLISTYLHSPPPHMRAQIHKHRNKC